MQLNSSKMGILGRVAAFAARVPVRVFTVHGWAFLAHRGLAGRLYLWAERLVKPLTTLFICPAAYEKQLGVEARACVADRTVVIPNAVDVGAFAQAALKGEPPVVVSVGRLHFPKDFVSLAHALGRLPPGSFRARVIGEGPDRPDIEEALRAGGVAEAVEVAGARDDVPEVLAAADVFVLSSLSECLPISILEAMAAGLPVVATRVGGVPELVADGETGLLVPAADPTALAQALRTLIEDADLRRRMGATGRERARERFDLPRFRQAHVNLLVKEISS